VNGKKESFRTVEVRAEGGEKRDAEEQERARKRTVEEGRERVGPKGKLSVIILSTRETRVFFFKKKKKRKKCWLY
jgi:hypothetical protein